MTTLCSGYSTTIVPFFWSFWLIAKDCRSYSWQYITYNRFRRELHGVRGGEVSVSTCRGGYVQFENRDKNAFANTEILLKSECFNLACSN